MLFHYVSVTKPESNKEYNYGTEEHEYIDNTMAR
jgi:hypothetical protein